MFRLRTTCSSSVTATRDREQIVKSIAIGRKKLAVRLQPAGRPSSGRSDEHDGLLQTLRAEPWHWLKSVLTDLPRGTALESLLPDVWLTANPEHKWNIAQRRRDERRKKGDL